jgi:uncharacterized protein (TIGR03437 family)
MTFERRTVFGLLLLGSGSFAWAQQHVISTVAGGAPPLTAKAETRAGAWNDVASVGTVRRGTGPRAPMTFEPNVGQFSAPVKFSAHASNYDVWLSGTSVLLDFCSSAGTAWSCRDSKEVAFDFLGGNKSAEIVPIDELATRTSYFVGSRNRWLRGVPHYRRLVFKNLYRGVDVEYHTDGRELQFDLLIQPGADPRVIRMDVRGADNVRITPAGDLEMTVGDRHIIQHRPYIFQRLGGGVTSVQGSYLRLGKSRIGFAVSRYDTRSPLIIDPVLTVAALAGTSVPSGFAVDGIGNIYVAGLISTLTPPGSALRYTFGSASLRAVIRKFTPAGDALLYEAYIGADDLVVPETIAVAADGTCYVGGHTEATDLPVTGMAPQQQSAGSSDGFLLRLNQAGSELLLSTYWGGSGSDEVRALAVDGSGSIYLAGATTSSDFPTLNAIQNRLASTLGNAFATKLDPAGKTIYSTYLGGTGYDRANSLGLDARGNVVITGYSDSTDFPTTPGAFMRTVSDAPVWTNAFVAKIDASGKLVYSTYLGGSRHDSANGCALQPDGSAIVVGATTSLDFPVSANALQPTNAAGIDKSSAFITRLSADGTAVIYSSYLGGSFATGANAVALDGGGNAVIVGGTDAPDFPTLNPIQSVKDGKTPTLLYRSMDGGASWQPLPLAGSFTAITAVSFSPTDSRTLFAATDGGVMKSSDSGQTWISSSNGLPTAFVNGASGRTITSLAVDQKTGTLYAGQGGVSKSSDGGSTWVQLSRTLDQTIYAISVDPNDSSRIYALGFNGLYRTTDGGQTWLQLSEGLPRGQLEGIDLVMDPQHSSTLYAATYVNGLFKSTDGGDTWAPANQGLVNLSATTFVSAIAISTSQPGVLYLAGNSGTAPALFRSTDGASSWTMISSPSTSDPPSSILIDPGNSQILYIGTNAGRLYKSTDAGASWQPLTLAWTSRYEHLGNLFPKMPVIADDARSNTLFAGIWQTTSDAFISKMTINAGAAKILYSTFLGSTGDDYGLSTAADATGTVYLLGTTSASDLFSSPPGLGFQPGTFIAKISDSSACAYSLSSTSLQPPAAGGSLTVAITAGAGCAWTISNVPNWISVSGSANGSGSVTITLVVAANSGAPRSAQISVAGITVTVNQASTVLLIGTGGVVNGASYTAPVAPGSIAAIFGNFLLAAPLSVSSFPIPTSLGGLSFQFGAGFLAPLFYANFGQVNAQIPWELASQSQATIIAAINGQTSAPQMVNLATYAPGIFALNGGGTGQGAILDANNLLVDSTNPATAGQTVVQIFCTGLGPVTNQPATGRPAPSNPLAQTTTQPTVMIGGVPATVQFSGLTPGYAGLYQVNALVPPAAAKGSAVPVAISIGGAQSNPVTIAVQ